MAHCLTKFFLSAEINVVVLELAKVNATLGALIKSLPMASLLALIWSHGDRGRRQEPIAPSPLPPSGSGQSERRAN